MRRIRMNNDLIMYGACARIAKASLAIANEHPKSTNLIYALQKHVSDVLDTFESEMLEKNKNHYVALVGVLRKNVEKGFNDINKLKDTTLEASVK